MTTTTSTTEAPASGASTASTEPMLLVDDRERAIIEELRALGPQEPSWWSVARLTHGDYAITRANETLIIIERKTYSDFAQSIKDSRMDNMARLVALRTAQQESTLRIALLLEGQSPADDDTVEGIPLKCIRAKIDHLWLRDDVHLIETANAQRTAIYLRDLVIHTRSLFAKTSSRAPCKAIGGLAQQKIDPPGIQTTIKSMFAAFPGIGKVTAERIVASGEVSIATFLITGCPSLTRLREQYMRERTMEIDIAIISQVRGISAGIARQFLAGGARTLTDVCQLPLSDLTNTTYNSRKLHKIGTLLHCCLHFKAAPSAPS